MGVNFKNLEKEASLISKVNEAIIYVDNFYFNAYFYLYGQDDDKSTKWDIFDIRLEYINRIKRPLQEGGLSKISQIEIIEDMLKDIKKLEIALRNVLIEAEVK